MSYEVTGSRTRYEGAIVTVRVDSVRMPDGGTKDREVVAHADSVAIVALDGDGRVLLISQYRHPVGRELTEIPAGLRDEPGEPELETAKRELREETGWSAQRWTRLLSLHTSPGIMTEAAGVFLAEDLTAGDRAPDPGSEELGIEAEWVALDDALARVRDGRITDALAVSGLFAAADHLRRRSG